MFPHFFTLKKIYKVSSLSEILGLVPVTTTFLSLLLYKVGMLLPALSFFFICTVGQEGFYISEQSNHVQAFLIFLFNEMLLEI